MKAKAEYLGLREDNTLTADFQDFLWEASLEYPIFSDKSLKILTSFDTTYRCEAGFSIMTNIKKKGRNRRDVRHGLRFASVVTNLYLKVSQAEVKSTFTLHLRNTVRDVFSYSEYLT
jgi:hypothetical protein